MVGESPQVRTGYVEARTQAMEEARLEALDSCQILDTEPEDTFDDLTQLAALACRVPIACVSLVDSARVFLKSRHGFDAIEVPRELSFCGTAVELRAELIVPDTSEDGRFKDSPLVTKEPHIRFYAGIPVALKSGAVLGTLCVLDTQPRELSGAELRALRTIAGHVSALLEIRTGSSVESQRRLASVLEVAPDLVAFASPSAQLLYINPAGRLMLGLSDTDTLLGLSLFSFIDDEEARKLREGAFATAIHQGVWSGETTYRRIDGSAFAASLLLMSHKTLDDELEYFSAISRDVTELREAERELHAREDELRHAQKMEAVGKLAGGIAHDFNNLLSAIIGFNELALNKLPTTHDARPDLEQIRRASKRSVALTRQILAFARKSVLQPQVVNLRDLIGESQRMIDRLIGDDVEVEFTPGPPGIVRVDPSQLEQVLLNLCLNARDAMPGGGRVTISTSNEFLDDGFARDHPEMTPGPHVCLMVRDTGSGIPPDIQSRIFEPFFTTKEHGKGSGLGLSTVHGIVKQSGGHIWVESEPEEGATFTICFPECEEEIDPNGTTRWKVHPGNRETILLAEDDELLRELICEVFTDANYQLIVAKDGQEALDLCEQNDCGVDLFLTDVIMPRMNGVDTARRLRAKNPNLKVVCMSGHMENQQLERRVLELGPFLHKPVTPSQLLATVRAILDAPA